MEQPDAQLLDELKPRELEILRLIAAGHSNREIADALFISVPTVRWYNKSIYSKLGVHSRTLAVAQAHELGLLEAEPVQVVAPKDNLPEPLTPFVGRVHELAEITALIDDPSNRLITIFGPGGVGKTRLMLAAAQARQSAFPDGVFMVTLEAIDAKNFAQTTALELVIATITSQLNLDARGKGNRRQLLLDYLRDKHLLLLLDGFEHVLNSADLLTEILSTAGAVKMIVTSREAMGVMGETVYVLNGMAVPESVDQAQDSDSVNLFIQSASRIRTNFVPGESAWQEIMQICAFVGGLPLGVELAASWVRALTIEDIVLELQRGLDILETRAGSIRAVFAKSWELLKPDERIAFAQLSVFHGGCTRKAAEVVTGASIWTLTALVDKSMLWHTPVPGRYSQHELLRQYGEEQLSANHDAPALHNQHCDYYAQYVQEWGLLVKTSDQQLALAALDRELDNIRSAWSWAVRNHCTGALEKLTEIWYYLEVRSRCQEGYELFTMALEEWPDAPDNIKGKLLNANGVCLWRLGQWDEAEASARQAIQMFEALDLPEQTLQGNLTLGNIFSMRGDAQAGQDQYQRTLALAQHYGDEWVECALLGNMSINARRLGQLDLALEYVQRMLTLAEDMGDEMVIGAALRNLGIVYKLLNRLDDAMQCFENSRAVAESINQRWLIAITLNDLGDAALIQQDYPQAQQLMETSLTLNREDGNVYDITFNLVSLSKVLGLQENYHAAHDFLKECLDLAAELSMVGNGIHALVAIAELLVQQGKFAAALSGLHMVSEHPLSDQESRDQAQQLMSQVIERLPTGEPAPDNSQFDNWQAIGYEMLKYLVVTN